jgi:lactoylglutathione lyase
MSDLFFPVVYTPDVARSVRFYESLGFERQYQFPPEGEPGYVTLRRGTGRLGIVTTDSPKELIGVELGSGPRFELFVYVEDVDASIDALRAAGVPVLLEPQVMPWGERIAYVCDPDGNPVVVAESAG